MWSDINVDVDSVNLSFLKNPITHSVLRLVQCQRVNLFSHPRNPGKKSVVFHIKVRDTKGVLFDFKLAVSLLDFIFFNLKTDKYSVPEKCLFITRVTYNNLFSLDLAAFIV